MTAVEFGAILLAAANTALPYLAGGAAAAVIIAGVWLGVRRAVFFFMILADMNSHSAGGNVGAAWDQSGARLRG